MQWRDQQQEKAGTKEEEAAISRPLHQASPRTQLAVNPDKVMGSPATHLEKVMSPHLEKVMSPHLDQVTTSKPQHLDQVPPPQPGVMMEKLSSQPGLHPDIVAVLSWQNEQLTRLQDQVLTRRSI